MKRSKIKPPLTKIVVLLLLFVAGAAMMSGLVTAQSATRTLPEEAVSSGEDFEVGIEALDYGTFCQIVETLPEGFAYVSSTLDPGSIEIEDDAVKFVLFGETSFTYTVTASSTEGSYTFSGLLKDDYKNEYQIGGDSEVIVGAAGAALTSIPSSQPERKDHVISPGPVLTPTSTPSPTLPTPTSPTSPTVAPTTAPPTVAPPTATPTATPTPEEPGFEAVFAIAGLLAVAYLVLRRKKR